VWDAGGPADRWLAYWFLNCSVSTKKEILSKKKGFPIDCIYNIKLLIIQEG
jgi:hypothetical protein